MGQWIEIMGNGRIRAVVGASPTDQTATRYRVRDGSGGHDASDRSVKVRPTR
jgi:hypothetical protein